MSDLKNKPLNPYIAGRAIKDKKGFFGRQDIFTWILTKIENLNTTSLVLYGQRRIGKTSLLLQIRNHLPSDQKFLSAFFDLQGRSRDPLRVLLSDLSETLAEATGIDSVPYENMDEDGVAFINGFLPNFIDSLNMYSRIILLLDGFDALDWDSDLIGIQSSKKFFKILHDHLLCISKLCVIASLGRNPDELSVELNFSLNIKRANMKEIWVLDTRSAVNIIEQAEYNKTLKFEKGASDKILALGNCHPYLTQLLCQRAWDYAYSKKFSSSPVINLKQIDDLVPDSLESGDPALRWMWEGLTTMEKACCATLANLSSYKSKITEKDLMIALQETSLPLRFGDVVNALKTLVNKNIFIIKSKKYYEFSIEFFRLWIIGYRLWDDVSNNFVNENVSDKNKLNVFLCHSSDDKPLVRDLYSKLTRDGFDAWLDEEKLVAGQDWNMEIDQAVHKANVIIVCLSKESIQKSGYLQKEIKRALDIAEEKVEGTIFIIPLRLEECDVPYQLKRWQWVDLYKSDGYEKLKKSLSLRASQL